MAKGRTILVTGGNRGIGLAIVKELAKNEDDRILMGCREMEVGKEIIKKLSGEIYPVEVNLSHKKTLKEDIKKIQKLYGDVSVLINNAGILTEGRFLEISDKDLEESMQVNVFGALELIKTFAPSMIKNKYGRIVNISSGWGSFSDGLTGPFSYSLSKATLNALTLTISNDLPKSVKINSMCPGWVKTRMGGEGATRSPQKGAETAVWLANLPEDGPSGQFFRDMKPISW